MSMLSDDDLNLRELSDAELDAAWDLWFDLAQSTNDDDPPYTHGVFQRIHIEPSELDTTGRDAGERRARPARTSRGP